MTYENRYDHPEGVMPLNSADHIVYSMEAYEKCLRDHDRLNVMLKQAYKAVQSDPENMKFQTRYHGLCILRDVDNGEDM